MHWVPAKISAPNSFVIGFVLLGAACGQGHHAARDPAGSCVEGEECGAGSACVDGICQIESEATEGPAYGAWSLFGDCSTSCGTGVETRTRACLTIEGTQVGCESCGGVCEEQRPCTASSCAYAYGAWSALSECVGSCGSAAQTRTRTCTVASTGAAVDCSLCGGLCSESVACTPRSCASYAYSPWSEFSSCSASCDGGTQTRTRKCLRNDGSAASCALCGEGRCSEQVACNTAPCTSAETLHRWNVPTTYYYQSSSLSVAREVATARAWCAALSGGWRLPTEAEYQAEIDHARALGTTLQFLADDEFISQLHWVNRDPFGAAAQSRFFRPAADTLASFPLNNDGNGAFVRCIQNR